MGKIKRVLLASYVNDSGDRMEWVLPEISAPEVALIASFLRNQYPGGDVEVSIVGIEPLTAFTEGFGGEFEDYLASAWKR